MATLAFSSNVQLPFWASRATNQAGLDTCKSRNIPESISHSYIITSPGIPSAGITIFSSEVVLHNRGLCFSH